MVNKIKQLRHEIYPKLEELEERLEVDFQVEPWTEEELLYSLNLKRRQRKNSLPPLRILPESPKPVQFFPPRPKLTLTNFVPSHAKFLCKKLGISYPKAKILLRRLYQLAEGVQDRQKNTLDTNLLIDATSLLDRVT